MLDRLIELLKKARMEEQAACLCACLDDVIDMPRGDEYIADYLLAHGVIVPPCKVGDTVYQVDAERVYPSVVKAVIYDTDGIAFDERASRSTTIKRVLSHLNRGDYYAEQAVKEGQYIEVYYSGEYKIDLQFERKC